MNDLMKHPAWLLGAGVLVVVAVLLMTKGGGAGSTYTTSSSGPSAADLKTIADANATTQASLTADKSVVLGGLAAYQKQRDDYATSVLKIRTDAATTAMQTSAAVQLGQAQIASSDKQAQISADTARNSSNNDFWGNLFGGIFGFLGGLL